MIFVKKNADKLKCTNDITFYNLDYIDCIKTLEGKNIDVIFLDPPYKMTNVDEIISFIDKYKLQQKDGIISFEMDKNTKCNDFIGNYSLIKDRTYGIKRVCIFKKEK